MKRPAVLVAFALFVVPAALIAYRVLSIGYQLFPVVQKKAWQISVESRIVKSGDGDTTVIVGLPQSGREYRVKGERTAGGPLNVTFLHDDPNRYGVWSGKISNKGAYIMYAGTVQMLGEYTPRAPEASRDRYLEDPWSAQRPLAERLTAQWKDLPPPERLRAVTAAEVAGWRNPVLSREDLEQWAAFREKRGKAAALLSLLRAAGLPSRAAQGLLLSDSVTDKPLTLLKVWTGDKWERVDPERGEVHEKPIAFLPLTWGGIPAVEVVNGLAAETRWTVTKLVTSQWSLHFERNRLSDRLLDRWSLLRIPYEFQGTFRILLLVPIGALMVSLLRNFVGFPTFGIFMPVLMALAFRNTGLGFGLGIFTGVLLIGYAARYLIDKLRLLLVPRLSVILTFVIGCYTLVALAGNRLGVRELMAVGLLPFVILTMSIERFFVILEEEGLREGLKTAAGSAAVAAITYGLINMEALQLTFFVFPELLLAVAGAQVLVGRYTGYRLSEVLRFKRFGRAQ